MKKKILILGSTGSIGCRTLDVIRDFPDLFEVAGLSSNNRIDILEKQISEFKPKSITFGDNLNFNRAETFAKSLNINVFKGNEGLLQLVQETDCDIVVVATVGYTGLIPTLKAIELKRTIALANKEVLVTAGHLVMRNAAKNNVPILPIDSEHNAIFQCLFGQDKFSVKRIILTASGGPFRNFSADALKNVTLEQALNHPTWTMGKKITIDSATLMNKGFEVIEGKWLFDIPIDKIDVVIHPQSVIHSMVEFIDASIIAQLGKTDMYLPIQNVLTYPQRRKTAIESLDFDKLNSLTFQKPDINVFKCLKFAFEAGKTNGSLPAAINAANEIAVERFLCKDIRFIQIPEIIEYVMNKHDNTQNPELEQIQETDRVSRDLARNYGK